MDKQLQSSQTAPTKNGEAIRHLEQAIAKGRHWYIVLLEAIGLWTATEEIYNGHHYHYLIDDEAFDWLLLAERLCKAVDDLLPADEKTALLFRGIPPISLATEEFKKLVGSSKYHQYLNYFYGITVEEALIQAVQGEVRKEKYALGFGKKPEHVNEIYQRIYGATETALLKQFRRARDYPQIISISLTELKEFAYWLFKYRLEHCDKAKVASDTNKALKKLRQQWADNGFPAELVADKPLGAVPYSLLCP